MTTPRLPRGAVGVIQGRLSPRPADRIQAFPRETWKNEFVLARELGFDGIEWIFEAPRHEENPVASAAGRREILDVAQSSGTAVQSICGDYFMVHRLSEDGDAGERAADKLVEVMEWTRELGARRILLPWLEEAALDTPAKREAAVRNLARVAPEAGRLGIQLGLEMEIAGVDYARVVTDVGHPSVVAYYDTGNSTAAGFDVSSDVRPLLPLLGAVHLKDRKRGGTSQYLGRGDTAFSGLFERLTAIDFAGDFVCQHYFEDPVRDATAALAFLRGFWPKERAA